MKILPSSVALLFLLLIQSKIESQTYQVAVSQRPYEDLLDGQSLVDGTWESLEFDVPLGFSLALFSDTIQSLISHENFAGGFYASGYDLSETNLILAFSPDLVDRGYELDSTLSPVTYKTEGETGSRIFTLEFENAGFLFGELTNDIYSDYINYQLKIYEESGDIEVHIGPYEVINPGLDFEGFVGPGIGLVEEFDFVNEEIRGEICILSGEPLSPDIIDVPLLGGLIWPIPENTVYRFYRPTSNVRPVIVPKNVDYYTPNPSFENVSLQTHLIDQIVGPVRVVNGVGKVVLEDNDPGIIELDGFPVGVYQLFFMTTEGLAVQRILRFER